MILNIQDDAPPRDREIYIVVIKKAIICTPEDEGLTIWCPFNEDFPIGYILSTDPVVSLMKLGHGKPTIPKEPAVAPCTP
jgi:hypothetical protein